MPRRDSATPLPKGTGGVPFRTRLAASVLVVVSSIAVLAGCTSSQLNGKSTQLPVDPNVPKPTATSQSSLSATLAVVTDYGSCDDGERKVADMIASWSPKLVATAGDNTQSVSDCTPYQQSVNDYYSAFLGGADGAHFFPVPGDKDYSNEGAGESAYLDAFRYLVILGDNPRWYTVNTGNVNLFMLDSELPADTMQEQKTWLQQALTKARTEQPGFWNIVVLHRPPFASGPEPENAAMQPQAGWDYKGWGADVVLSGHERLWENLEVDGLPYVIGGVGASTGAATCPATLLPQSKGCVSGTGAVLVSGFTDKLTLEYRTPDGGAGKTAATVTVTR